MGGTHSEPVTGIDLSEGVYDLHTRPATQKRIDEVPADSSRINWWTGPCESGLMARTVSGS